VVWTHQRYANGREGEWVADDIRDAEAFPRLGAISSIIHLHFV